MSGIILVVLVMVVVVKTLMHLHDDIKDLQDSVKVLAAEVTRLKVKAHLEQMMAARDS